MPGPWERFQQPTQAAGPWARFQTPEPVAEPEQRGFLDELGRQAGLAARYVGEGAAGLAGVVVDPINATVDWATGRNATMPLGQAAGQLATDAGLPQPEGSQEELIAAASRGLVGTALTGGAGLAANVPALSANLGAQGVAAVTGSGASELARQGGAGTGGQIAAGIVGGLAPGAIAGIPNAARSAFRGSTTAEEVAETIKNFEAANSFPTAGQATNGGGVTALLESGAGKIPGGYGVMTRNAEAQSDAIGARVKQIADDLSPNADGVKAGRVIEAGITGPGGFIQRFKDKSAQLYAELDSYIPPSTPIELSRTRNLLDQMAAPIPGAENTSLLLSNPKLAQIRDAIAKDVGDLPGDLGVLPYDAAKQLRTKIGNEIADAGLVSDLPKAQLKRLYGALTQDMGVVAAANPAAKQAKARAEAYYKAGQERIENVERVVEKAGGPEKIFAAAMSGTKDGDSVLRAVMRSLKPDERNVVTAAVVDRLGKATPGAQNAAGDAFSLDTYLTNLNKLSPQAKTTLFQRAGSAFRENMDRIGKAVESAKSNARQYGNSSNTARGTEQITTLKAILGSTGALAAGAGSVGGVAGAAAVPVAANLTARAMTNPTFVRWLATNGRKPAANMAAQLGTLSEAARNDEDLAEVVDALRPLAGLKSSGAQAGGDNRNNPIAVRTPQEAQALPKGTWVMLPDGSIEVVE